MHFKYQFIIKKTFKRRQILLTITTNLEDLLKKKKIKTYILSACFHMSHRYKWARNLVN